MNPSARHRRHARTALLLVLALLWQPLWPLLAVAGEHMASAVAAADSHCAEMPAADCCDEEPGAPPCGEDPFCVTACTLLRVSVALPSVLPAPSAISAISPVPDWYPTSHPAGPPGAPPLRPPISA